MRWGRRVDPPARATLLLVAVLLAVALAMLAAGWDGAQARLRTQGTYCVGCGSHPSRLAMWSDDGMRTWRLAK